jgi:hypothetical protein
VSIDICPIWKSLQSVPELEEEWTDTHEEFLKLVNEFEERSKELKIKINHPPISQPKEPEDQELLKEIHETQKFLDEMDEIIASKITSKTIKALNRYTSEASHQHVTQEFRSDAIEIIKCIQTLLDYINKLEVRLK